ncbi:MAG: hypothetical protein CMJ49_10820 [Planctomycetaceae bacterium]|nr:hypothetical protein [Planctomycetaceae bacterium]
MTHIQHMLNALRPNRRRVAVAVFALLGMTLLGVVPPLIFMRIIDDVIAARQWHLLPLYIALSFAFPWISGIFQFVADYLVSLVGERLVFDIRLDLYRKVHRLHTEFMQNTTTGKLMERLRGDVGQLQTLLTQNALQLGVQLIYGLAMIAVMAFISGRLTILVLLAIALYVANYRFFVRRIRAVQRRYRRKMDVLSGLAQERLAGSIVVKAFNNERRESRDFARQNFLAERVGHRFRLLNNAYGITSSAITWGIRLVVLLLGVYIVIDEAGLPEGRRMTYGMLTAFLAYTMRLLEPAIMLSQLSSAIEQARVSLDRIFDLMFARPDTVDLTGQRLPELQGAVTFENVCFEYEPGKRVLDQLNLYVAPGQTVALVGETGCGKTTITKLLYRYYEPQAGHLTIDDYDISQLDTKWYRQHLALVPQDPIVFDTTIAHNIAYGRPGADDDAITDAARKAEIGPLVDRLPNGIHTRLGEYGEKLSVGEKQRICIARAILADPVILILDEATSSLDTESEVLIQRALASLMEGRTSFVVAHRLSTIRSADLIVVLDRGRVLELGSHDELMANPDGRYHYLYTTQMASTPEVTDL